MLFIIVGGGIGGLTAAIQLSTGGHTAIILEENDHSDETGGGIQLAPNATRILIRMGLGKCLEEHGVRPKSLVFRRYATGDVIASHTTANFENEHGAPFVTIRRSQLVEHLLATIKQDPRVDFKFNSRVSSVHIETDTAKPFVILEDGNKLHGDVIIGADGVHSICRELVTGTHDRARDTGDAAYRAVIPTSQLLSDPDTESLVACPDVTIWLGPGKHVVGYCISGSKEYNIVLAHPNIGSTESWKLEGSAERMREEFIGWEPRVTKILAHVRSTYKWKLVDRPALDQWVHPSGRLLLIGDACHPMLPYRAQGAAMAIEDTATIGELFSSIEDPRELPTLALAFQELRSSRCSDAQSAARRNQTVFHLPDGPLQEARDAEFQNASKQDRKASFDYDVSVEIARWRAKKQATSSPRGEILK